MKRDELGILLKDLSARLPYGVKVQVGNLKQPYKMVGIHSDFVIISTEVGDDYYDISKVKPYLRPMLSMTEEEMKMYERLYYHRPIELIDFVNSHHFDYMGLIGKGLALEAPSDMYKK